MTADKPTPVVPNLRFPEFRSAGDWHFQPLSDIAELISEGCGSFSSGVQRGRWGF